MNPLPVGFRTVSSVRSICRRLPFVAVLAYFFFGQGVDVWTWVGAAVIAASAVYIAHRESRMARQTGATPTTHRVPQERV